MMPVRRCSAAVAGVLVAAAVLSACGSATEPREPTGVDVRGAWSYAGFATQPVGSSVEGRVDITVQRGADFQGTLDLTRRDAGGALQRLAGVVSGEALDTRIVTFQGHVGGRLLRHVGIVEGDSIRGEWFEESGTAVLARGSFRMKQ